MKERPIIFSAPMIKAILDGSKTMTRRVLRKQPADILPMKGEWAGKRWVTLRERLPDISEQHGDIIRCRLGDPGDSLWIREGWAVHGKWDKRPPSKLPKAARVWYSTDGPKPAWAGRKRSGRFMPRWASRITLEITGVRVERLQEITEEDAIAEGFLGRYSKDEDGIKSELFSPIEEFRATWDSLNSSSGFPWESNCYVWVISFRRI